MPVRLLTDLASFSHDFQFVFGVAFRRDTEVRHALISRIRRGHVETMNVDGLESANDFLYADRFLSICDEPVLIAGYGWRPRGLIVRMVLKALPS